MDGLNAGVRNGGLIFNNSRINDLKPSTDPNDVDNHGLWEAGIPFEECLGKAGFRHAVHGMIYAPWAGPVLDLYNPRAAILMQMRFDGHVGFPGGIVDECINDMDPKQAMLTVTEAFRRELDEEVNMDLTEITITVGDYAFSYANAKKDLFMHFFHVPVKLEQLVKLEKAALTSKEYGQEVLGHIRPPLYTMKDGYRGLPAFLNNLFIGSSKDQLIRSLVQLEIFNIADVTLAVNASKKNCICACSNEKPRLNLPIEDEFIS